MCVCVRVRVHVRVCVCVGVWVCVCTCGVWWIDVKRCYSLNPCHLSCYVNSHISVHGSLPFPWLGGNLVTQFSPTGTHSGGGEAV